MSNTTYVYIETEEELEKAVENQIKPYCLLTKGIAPRFALDLETYTLLDQQDPRYEIPRPIRLLTPRWVSNIFTKKTIYMEFEGMSSMFQLGADPRLCNLQWMVDVKKVGEKAIAKHLKDIVESSFIIGHNIKYDIGFLATQYDIWLDPTKIRDTQIMDQVIISGRNDKTSLGENYRRYIDFGFFVAETHKTFSQYEDFKSDMQTSDWAGEPSDDQLLYASHDVMLIHYVYERQKEVIKKFLKKHPHSGMLRTITEECELVPDIALMELRGVKYDSDYHNNVLIPFLELKYKEAYEQAMAICPNPNVIKYKGRGKAKYGYQPPINFNSSQQVPKILAMLGVKVENSKEDTLKAVRSEHPAVEFILRCRKAESLLNKFGNKLPKFVHEDGKIYPNFRQIGTETGRFSSSKPNMQNIPMKGTLFGEVKAGELFRKAFIAQDSTYSLIDCDYSNIEPRIIAESTQSPTLIDAFKKGIDYHGLTAQLLLDLPEIPARGTDEREITGKIGNLSLGYCAGWPRLKQNMYIYTLDRKEGPMIWTEEEARAKHAKYFEKLPEIKEAIQEVKDMVAHAVRNNNSLADFAGRKPIFTIHTRVKKRHRSFYLSGPQEGMAGKRVTGDPRDHELHKNHVKVEKITIQETQEDGTIVEKVYYKRSNYNEFAKTIGNIAREAYNYRIQGEAANILKKAMLNMGYRRLRELGFDIFTEGVILTIHDEVVFQVKKENAEKALKFVQDCMISAGEEVIKSLPVKADPGIGQNWSESKA